MTPFGVWQPIFDNDRLPSNITRTYQNPIASGKIEEDDGAYADIESDDDPEGEDSDEYEDVEKIRSRIKRAQTSATPAKRAPSVAPLVNPQYGETIPTPRQQGALARRKPVRVDMDSEDEMIWNMKNVGYKDEPVATELVKMGKIHYDPKTIATRYSRIKKTQLAHQEQILNEDFSDFHEEEDDALAECLEQTEVLYRKDLEAIISKRYSRVAELVNARLERKKYTKLNARSRLISIQNGTAVCPLEKDPHPVVRTAHRTRQVTMGRTAREEAREAERRNRIEIKERTEREAAELAARRIEEEQDRRMKREAREKKKKETAVTRETRLKIKQEEEETKAERAAMRAIQSIRKKKEVEEDRAARRWTREQEKLARHAAKEQAALEKIEKDAEVAKAKIVNKAEENQRRELIRRHLRAAGVLTAAPIEPARKRIERKAGVYSAQKTAYDSDEEKKPDKEVLDEAVEGGEKATWSPWTAKGRAAARRGGKTGHPPKSHEVIDDSDA